MTIQQAYGSEKTVACRLSLVLLLAAIVSAVLFRDWIAGAAGIVWPTTLYLYEFLSEAKCNHLGHTRRDSGAKSMRGRAISTLPALVWDRLIRHALVLYVALRHPLPLRGKNENTVRVS